MFFKNFVTIISVCQLQFLLIFDKKMFFCIEMAELWLYNVIVINNEQGD